MRLLLFALISCVVRFAALDHTLAQMRRRQVVPWTAPPSCAGAGLIRPDAQLNPTVGQPAGFDRDSRGDVPASVSVVLCRTLVQ